MRQPYKRTSSAKKWPESQTIPQQSLTVPQLFERFRKGIPVSTNTRQPIYTDSTEDLEKLSRLSPMEKFDLSNEYRQQAEQINAELRERESAATERLKEAQKGEANKGETKPA